MEYRTTSVKRKLLTSDYAAYDTHAYAYAYAYDTPPACGGVHKRELVLRRVLKRVLTVGLIHKHIPILKLSLLPKLILRCIREAASVRARVM